MKRGLDYWMSKFQTRLEKEEAKESPHPAILHSYTSALGRAYYYLGDTENAKKWLERGIEYCIEILDEIDGQKQHTFEYGKRCLECAQEMWLICDSRSTEYLLKASSCFQDSLQFSDVEEIWRVNWFLGITLIFLGKYDQAITTLKELVKGSNKENRAISQAVLAVALALDSTDKSKISTAQEKLRIVENQLGAVEYDPQPNPSVMLIPLLSRELEDPEP